MAKPEWMEDRRRRAEIDKRMKKCIDCRHKGRPCGRTNYMGPGKGREIMYECSKHPSVHLYSGTDACMEYEPRA